MNVKFHPLAQMRARRKDRRQAELDAMSPQEREAAERYERLRKADPTEQITKIVIVMFVAMAVLLFLYGVVR